MNNLYLTNFNRNPNIANKPDFGEKLGAIGLGLLRIGFGQNIAVEKVSANSKEISYTKKIYSLSSRVAAIALCILILPLTALLAGIGCLGIALSQSQRKIYHLYNRKIISALPPKTAEDRAAILIQKHVRGFLARKVHLSRDLYPQYQKQCDQVNESKANSIPKARGGKTNVYLPQEMPEVILKESGRKSAITRFHQMQEIRTILNAQNSSHLIIPKANLCQNFLVEERLAIDVDSYHNMGLYLSQPAQFDEAVRELTRLFSKIYLSDLLGYQNIPLGHIPGAEGFVRYDNLPLYLVEENGKKIGKIGLIDLEHLQRIPSSDGLETLARIFPLHLDVIKQEASRLQMKMNEASLAASAEKGRKCLQVGFSDHLQWLQQNNISPAVLHQSFQVSSQRITELTTRIEQECLTLNQGVNDLFAKKGYLAKPQKNFFTENPQKIAQELATEITPLIIRNIQVELAKKQKEELAEIQAQDITESQLVSLRSPIIHRLKLYEGVVELLSNHPKIQFEQDDFHEKRDIAEQVTSVILEELSKRGEIFYFDPGYYTGGHNLCWIRY